MQSSNPTPGKKADKNISKNLELYYSVVSHCNKHEFLEFHRSLRLHIAQSLISYNGPFSHRTFGLVNHGTYKKECSQWWWHLSLLWNLEMSATLKMFWLKRVTITTSMTTEHLGSCNSQLKWRFSDYVISGIADELVAQLKAAPLVYLRPPMKL